LTDPDQLLSVEDAVHDVAFVVASVSVKLVPRTTVVTEGVSVPVGAGAIVTIAVPVIFVYPGTVEVAMIVAVVVAVIVEEAVNAPAAVIVPSDVGLTDQVTTWLGLFCPWTNAANDWLPPGATVLAEGLTVTSVTVVVVPPPVLPPAPPPPPQPARVMAMAK
jgi:hypothetical protein